MSHSALSSLSASTLNFNLGFPAPLTLQSQVTLNSGHTMPILGFGTWSSENAEEACSEAIKLGYRHLDSARIYGTEIAVSRAVEKCQVNREDMFLTTKIRGMEHGTESCKEALLESTTAPRPYYWDLVLLHDPLAGPEARHQAYKVLAEAQKSGKVKSIGVSNFGVDHLKKLEQAGVGPTPAVNQKVTSYLKLELHPWCQQTEIVEYCQSKGIVLQAYCPLARGKYMEDLTLVNISKRVNKTPAQVLLRWSLQRGFVPLPKSDKPNRIAENQDIFDFELTHEDMNGLNSLGQGKDTSVSWTASFEGVE